LEEVDVYWHSNVWHSRLYTYSNQNHNDYYLILYLTELKGKYKLSSRTSQQKMAVPVVPCGGSDSVGTQGTAPLRLTSGGRGGAVKGDVRL
jgi:hypothetical protein